MGDRGRDHGRDRGRCRERQRGRERGVKAVMSVGCKYLKRVHTQDLIGSQNQKMKVAPLPLPTKGPMWGYPRCGLGAVGAVLEPFCGHLSPKLDKVY